MKEKSEQEQRAAEKQVELISDALNSAKDNAGFWMNQGRIMPPRLYPKGPSVSPFNALILGLHTDKNGYKTANYTFFQDAKARGESVKEKEKGVPFNWYNWSSYVNRHNPKDVISRNDYLKLSPEEKEMYKGVHNREIRILFNVDQTMLPHVDKEKYQKLIDRFGGLLDRGYIKNEERQLHQTVNRFADEMKQHFVPIRKDVSGVAHYHTEKDVIYMPEQKHFAMYTDYVQELMRQLVSATGHQQRLAREGMVMKGGKAPSEDSLKYEQLVAEVASGIKMRELGCAARLSESSLAMVDYWTRELKENPCLIDNLESDVNNALDVIRKAEKGEKIEYASYRNRQQTDELREKQKPQVDSTESAILVDIIRQGGMRIAEGNFQSPEEKRAFMEKFSLSHYETQMNHALGQTANTDPDIVENAYTEALSYGARIAEACREYLPEQWNTKGHYLVAEILKNGPDKDTKEIVVVKDRNTGITDVVLPAGAMAGGKVVMPDKSERPYILTPDEVMSKEERTARQAEVITNCIKGFSKQRIERALKNEGATYVRFFNNDGALGYRPDDSYFKDKDVYAGRLNGHKLELNAMYDVDEAIKMADTVLFDRIQMMQDDNARWTLYIKPQGEDSFSIYPAKEDVNQFFSTIRQGQQTEGEKVRVELAQKYYALAAAHPELRVDLFGAKAENEDLSRIQRVNIYKRKDERIFCAPVIDGIDKVEPREISFWQYQRLWVSEDRTEYKANLAAKLFSDVLHEQKAQNRESKDEPLKTEETKDIDEPELNEIRQQRMKQFEILKEKHPEAILLFRSGKFYESFKEDAEKVSRITGITLTQKDMGTGAKIPNATFPEPALDTYLPKLVRAGERIAICDWQEIAKREQQEQQPERSSYHRR